jgi:hypothetical protein
MPTAAPWAFSWETRLASGAAKKEVEICSNRAAHFGLFSDPLQKLVLVQNLYTKFAGFG